MNLRHSVRLAYFVGLSLVAHVMLIAGSWLPPPQRVVEPVPLIARLQQSESPQPVWRRPRAHHPAPPATRPVVSASAPSIPPSTPIEPVVAAPETFSVPAAEPVPEVVAMPSAPEAATVEA